MKYFEIYKDSKRVKFIHYMPFDEDGLGKTKEELLKTGYLVENLPDEPDPELHPGFYHDLYYDEDKKELYYVKKEIKE